MSEEAKRNREAMPTIAGVVDLFMKHFGDGIKITYAKENGVEIGRKPEDWPETEGSQHGL